MPRLSLSGRAVLNVTGEDAEDFLQNLITTDLDTLEHGDLKPAPCSIRKARSCSSFSFHGTAMVYGLIHFRPLQMIC